MIRKRMKMFAICILLGFCLLLGRLMYIQLFGAESFSRHRINLIEASVNQRLQSIVLDDGRGRFVDKEGKPINHHVYSTVLLFPFLKKMDWPSKELAEIVDLPASEIELAVLNATKPFALMKDGEQVRLTETEAAAINRLSIPGVFAAKLVSPGKDKVAEQLIGGLTSRSADHRHEEDLEAFVPQGKVGDKGLQEQFDDFLQSIGETRLAFHVDGMGGPLFGVDVKYLAPANPLFPVTVETTLDLEAQVLAERIADEHGLENGGILLLDIESSEIRAVVSRPKVNQANPNQGSGSKNVMFMQSTAGSVFKTVTAAAAIEEGAVRGDSVFDCNKKLDGSPIGNDGTLMGILNFTDSFARSCNRTFGELAKQMVKEDPDVLDEYAAKLQLTGTSGWTGKLYHSSFSQLYREEKGQIWHQQTGERSGLLIAQTAIGQQDVQVTPLGAANMMATIARGGERRLVKAVSAVKYANGTTAAEFKDIEPKGAAIKTSTAKRLQSLMREVVVNEHGTARMMNDLSVTVAGKTGTAQTDKEKKLMNKWFAGYFPAENPKYAIVAVKLQVKEEVPSATRMARDYIEQVGAMEKE